MRYFAIAILFILQISAQNSFKEIRIASTFSSVYSGIEESLEWYDIPIGAIYFSRQIFNKNNFGDMIFIPPTSYEINFSNSFNKNNSQSPGSINKDLIPHTIFLSRLGINMFLDLFTDRKVSSLPYRNAFIFQKSLLYTYTITEIAKNIFKRSRPDNTDDRSFFSGHTSTTFAAATFLFLELNDFYNSEKLFEKPLAKSILKTVTFSTLYGWAGYVGYCRIKDSRHYLSDVIVGASIGTLISFLVYDKYFCGKDSPLSNINIYNLHDSLLLSFSLKF